MQIVKSSLLVGILIAFCSSCFAAVNAEKAAYSLQSLEMARRHYIQTLYSDTVVRTLYGIWDLETDTQLARDNDGGSLGALLDFDLGCGRVLYRREEYDSATRKSSFIFEVRNQVNEVVFTKKDSVSHEPEAYFIADGTFMLSRTNDANTLELTLELHSIETGKRVWRRTPGGSPRWRLSKDGRTFTELLSERAENYFHTALSYDTFTQTELDRSDLRGLKITRETSYLAQFEAAIGIQTGQSGTLLLNEKSRTLSPLSGFRGGISSQAASPKVDSEERYIILDDFDASFGEPAWSVFDARTGERIASNLELASGSMPIGLLQDPAISPDGQLLYQVVEKGEIEVWNPHTKTLVRELSYTNIPFVQLFPSADNRYLLACALSGLNDDFIVLIDTETNLPIYSKLIDDPDIFDLPSGGVFVPGFSRFLRMPKSGDRYYLSTTRGFEAFDYRTGEKVEDGSKFKGKALTTCYVEAQKSWITVYETGRVKIENDEDATTSWIQLPNTVGVRYAAVDSLSGSIAYQHDNAFFVTHPFDARADQWIEDLSLGIYPHSLHRGGKWLAADFRGIYDLETEEWLPLEESFYSIYAIDNASARWALYDSTLDAIIIYDLDEESKIEIPMSGQFSVLRAMRFSADGTQVYCLAQPATGSHYDQSLYALDIESRSIAHRIDLNEMEDSHIYTQIEVHPNGRQVALGRRNGTVRLIDLDTSEESLPAFIEPIYSAEWDNGEFELAAPKADGTIRFVDEYGHVYQLQQTTARLIPSQIVPSSSSDSQLLFDEKPERTYWIQTSEDLKHWSTHPGSPSIGRWFDGKDAVFFKVFESESSN